MPFSASHFHPFPAPVAVLPNLIALVRDQVDFGVVQLALHAGRITEIERATPRFPGNGRHASALR